MLVAVALVLVLAIGAGPIIDIIGGDAYHDAGPVLRIQAFALLGAFAGGVWTAGLVGIKRQSALILTNAIALISSPRPRRCLRPRGSGRRGAAIAAVLGEASLALAVLVMLVRARPALLPRFGFALRLAAAAVLGLACISHPRAPAPRAGRPCRRRLLGRGLCARRRPGRGSRCFSAQAARVNSASAATATPPSTLRACASASSTTASSRTRSAAPSAGTATSRERLAAAGTRSRTSRCASGSAATARRSPACGSSPSARGSALYAEHGRRRIVPPLVFGAGVLWHLAAPRPPLRRRAHCLVPVLLAARRGARCAGGGGYRLVVDWHEVWTRAYWREYLGTLGAASAGASSARAYACRSARSASRGCTPTAARGRLRGDVTCSRASTPGDARAARAAPGRPGRRLRRPPHPREARTRARPRGRARPRRACPSLRCGSSATAPSANGARARSRATASADVVDAAGLRRQPSVVDAALGRALCLVLPVAARGLRARRRRGRGARHAERRRARARTTRRPSSSRTASTASSPPSASPDDLAAAIVWAYRAGLPLRETTAAWFERRGGGTRSGHVAPDRRVRLRERGRTLGAAAMGYLFTNRLTARPSGGTRNAFRARVPRSRATRPPLL